MSEVVSEVIAGGLDAHVEVRRAGHTLDVALSAAPGEVVAVVGPNGSGKSTLLGALAGLVPLTSGRVAFGSQTWDEGEQRLEVRHRGVGLVFQDSKLFPHLSLLENVAFGPRCRGVPRAEAHDRAHAWLDRFGLHGLADRRPRQVSGGQAQRAALARALAAEPRLLLLDEPLAALDVGVAMTLRLELARHLADFDGVTLLVTHDALDALTLADRVLVLDDGRVAQEGPTAEVARRPRTSHVARLVGLNVLHGTSSGNHVRLVHDLELVTIATYDGPVTATFSPAAVTVGTAPSTSSARNQWQGRVVSVVPHGLAVRVHLDVGTALIADLTAESAARLGLTPGREVWATVKATEVAVHPDPWTGGDAPIP